jgi:hypothetical protein
MTEVLATLWTSFAWFIMLAPPLAILWWIRER